MVGDVLLNDPSPTARVAGFGILLATDPVRPIAFDVLTEGYPCNNITIEDAERIRNRLNTVIHEARERVANA